MLRKWFFKSSLTFMFLALATGCSPYIRGMNSAGGTFTGVGSGSASVAITSPVITGYVGSSNAASYAVSGTCSENGQPVVLSGPASASPTCTSGTWNANINVSAQADGSLILYANHSNALGAAAPQDSVNLVKDVQNPNNVSFINPSSNVTLGSTSYNFSWNTTDNGPAGLASSNTYQIEKFNN